MSTSESALPGLTASPRRARHSWTPELRSTLTFAATLVMVVLAAALAAVSATELVAAGARTPTMLVLGSTAGLCLVVLGLTSIESFVVAVLLLRSGLDALKLPQGSAGADPAAVLAVLTCVVAMLWLLAQRRDRATHMRLSPLAKSLLVFTAAALLGVLVSAQQLVSLIEWARIASLTPMLILVEQVAVRRRDSIRLLVAIYGAAMAPLLLAAYQAMTGSGVFVAGGFDRVKGTFAHSNPFAVFLSMLIVVAVALLPHTTRWTRLGLVAFLGAGFPALVATYTRGAWIATFVGICIVGALQSRKIIVAMLVGTAIVAATVPSVTARFADLAQATHDSGAPGNSLTWRVHYWTEALSLSEQSPVSGIGLKMVAADTVEGKQPHNDIIRAFVELGVVGLLAYVALLVSCVRTAMRSVRATRNRAGPSLERGVAVAFAGVAGSFLLLILVANVMSQVVLLWYFFALAGLAIAAGRRAGSADAEEPGKVEDANPARE